MAEKEYKLSSINDLLHFDDAQFARLLPDLIAWRKVMREAMEIGAEPQGMIWVDDEKPGQIHSVQLQIKETGEVLTYKGEAWSEDAGAGNG